MHKPSRPRTPRYWPRMKVRGARRKRLLQIYALQRFGDVMSVRLVPDVEPFIKAMNRFVDASQMIRNEYWRTDGSD